MSNSQMIAQSILQGQTKIPPKTGSLKHPSFQQKSQTVLSTRSTQASSATRTKVYQTFQETQQAKKLLNSKTQKSSSATRRQSGTAQANLRASSKSSLQVAKGRQTPTGMSSMQQQKNDQMFKTRKSSHVVLQSKHSFNSVEQHQQHFESKGTPSTSRAAAGPSVKLS